LNLSQIVVLEDILNIACQKTIKAINVNKKAIRFANGFLNHIFFVTA